MNCRVLFSDAQVRLLNKKIWSLRAALADYILMFYHVTITNIL